MVKENGVGRLLTSWCSGRREGGRERVNTPPSKTCLQWSPFSRAAHLLIAHSAMSSSIHQSFDEGSWWPHNPVLFRDQIFNIPKRLSGRCMYKQYLSSCIMHYARHSKHIIINFYNHCVWFHIIYVGHSIRVNKTLSGNMNCSKQNKKIYPSQSSNSNVSDPSPRFWGCSLHKAASQLYATDWNTSRLMCLASRKRGK